MSGAPTEGLRAAIRSGDAALASEAAISTGEMCLAGKASADAELVDALAAVAGRNVVRIAVVIDANAGRASTMEAALAAEGVSVTTLGSGAEGLGLLRRVAGVDAVIVADTLPDLTTHQVIDEVSAGTRTASAPILVVSDDTDSAGELFGESATVIGGGDAAAVVAAMGEQMNAGRARADRLAGQAAAILAGLAASGQDISAAVDGLAGSLAGRPDSVSIPAAEALGYAGGPGQAGDLLALLGDEGRSDEARAAAGFAAAALFQRGGSSSEAAQYLMAVIHSDASLTVRKSAYAALGSLDLTPAQRAELLTGAGHTEG
jgi:CheY-like chemotaxis protein